MAMTLVALGSIRALVLPVDAVVMAFPVMVLVAAFPMLMLGVLVMAVLPMIVLPMLRVTVLAVTMFIVLVPMLAIVMLGTGVVTLFSFFIGMLLTGIRLGAVIATRRAMIVPVRVPPLPGVRAEAAAINIPAVVRLRR